LRTVVGIRLGLAGRPDGGAPAHRLVSLVAPVLSDENWALPHLIQDKHPRTVLELAELSGRAPSNLSRTLRNVKGYGLVKLRRDPGTRAVRPETLATKFLVVLDRRHRD
jgi:predicted transcriptional regulator